MFAPGPPRPYDTAVKASAKKSKNASTSVRKFDALLAGLRASGLKQTPARRAILQVLWDEHGPFSVEEIHLRSGKDACDQATVYRCLGSLEEAGLIHRCEFGDGAARYELAQADQGHHHHLVCTGCRKIEIIDDEALEEIDQYAKKRGYSNIHHKLEFFGTCPDCRAR